MFTLLALMPDGTARWAPVGTPWPTNLSEPWPDSWLKVDRDVQGFLLGGVG